MISRWNSNVFQFDSIEELNGYIKRKYQDNANMLQFKEVNLTGAKLFAITFNHFQEIAIGETKGYISIQQPFILDISNSKCAIIGAANINKGNLNNFHCYTNEKDNSIFVTSTKYMKTIELIVVFVDIDERPDWIHVLYSLTT